MDYRLAPEHDIQVIHSDCYEALNWVMTHALTYKLDRSRLALWGCSAGAHLAATVAMRDAEEHAPSRIRQMNLVVPAVCHPDNFDSDLKITFLRKQEYSGKKSPEFYHHMKSLYGAFFQESDYSYTVA